MLLPTDLSPEKLNLAWRMKFAAAQYERSGTDSGFDWAVISTNIAEEKYTVSLLFDEQGLGCITSIALQSKFFDECEEEEIEAVSNSYTQIFHQMVSATTVLLGEPDLLFDGTEGGNISLPDNQGVMRTTVAYDIFSEDIQINPTYCKWLSSTDYPIAFWNRGSSHYRIGQSQDCEEFPIILTVSVTRLDS